MRRVTTIAVLYLFVLATTPGPTLADSPHFKHGSPQSTDNGLTLTVSGALAGLGNGDIRLKVGASANPTASCCNPSGPGKPNCEAPGQNPAAATVTSATVLIPGSSLKNGTTPFSVTTQPPTTPIAGAPECPNSSWTENITDMAFTQAALRIQQSSAEGTTDFSDIILACITYSPPTVNGAVSSANFTVVVGIATPVGSCPDSLFPTF
jgi:hypothetical protein